MDEGKVSGLIAEDGVHIVDIKVRDSEDGGTVVIHNVEEK